MDTPAPAAPEAPKPAAPAQPAAPIVDAVQPEAPKPDRVFTQAELDDIIKKKDAKRLRERDELRSERDALRKLLLERGEQPKPEAPKPQGQPGEGEPKRDQFASYEEYIEARAEWRAEQKVEKKFKEREDADRQRSDQERQKKAGDDFGKMLRESAKDIEDFEDTLKSLTAEDAAGKISTVALEACDAPGKMLYQLIKNPEEAERIASLPVGKQARELMALETKFATAKKPSKAPEPINPVGGKAAVADEMPDPNKNQAAWVKWREEQIRSKAKGGNKRA